MNNKRGPAIFFFFLNLITHTHPPSIQEGAKGAKEKKENKNVFENYRKLDRYLQGLIRFYNTPIFIF